MDAKMALFLPLLLAAPSSAAVRLAVAPGLLAPDSILFTEAAVARLLEAPVRAEALGGLSFTAAAWKTNLAPADRERRLRALEALWGKRFSVQDDSPAGHGPRTAPPPVAFEFRGRTDAMRERLDGMPRPLERTGQDRFYDASRASQGSAVAAGPFASARDERPILTAAEPRPRSAPPPPPMAPKAQSPISWRTAGLEVLKGAGHTIKEVFTWKGLAIAAGSVALVTVAPVAIYGLLAVGAAFAGWTIGKALVGGAKAYKAGDVEGFYAASREMGRGTLALGLTMLGARHPPTNFRPHFPRTSGEWRAMAAAMDDEPVVAVSILRGGEKKRPALPRPS